MEPWGVAAQIVAMKGRRRLAGAGAGAGVSGEAGVIKSCGPTAPRESFAPLVRETAARVTRLAAARSRQRSARAARRAGADPGVTSRAKLGTSDESSGERSRDQLGGPLGSRLTAESVHLQTECFAAERTSPYFSRPRRGRGAAASSRGGAARRRLHRPAATRAKRPRASDAAVDAAGDVEATAAAEVVIGGPDGDRGAGVAPGGATRALSTGAGVPRRKRGRRKSIQGHASPYFEAATANRSEEAGATAGGSGNDSTEVSEVGVSCQPGWEPPASPFDLLEERRDLWQRPWRLLVACVLLNQVSWHSSTWESPGAAPHTLQTFAQ